MLTVVLYAILQTQNLSEALTLLIALTGSCVLRIVINHVKNYH